MMIPSALARSAAAGEAAYVYQAAANAGWLWSTFIARSSPALSFPALSTAFTVSVFAVNKAPLRTLCSKPVTVSVNAVVPEAASKVFWPWMLSVAPTGVKA